MSLGTVFGGQQIRSFPPKALIKHFNLDVKIADTDDAAFKKNFPLGKVPGFLGPKGFKLHEVIAVSIYLINLADPKSKLLGKNAAEYAQILKWASFTNSEFLPNVAAAFKPLTGAAPYNKKAVDDALAYVEKIVAIFETRLANYTYLVGERLTFADVFSAILFVRGFNHLFGAEWRKAHPNTTRWFKTIIATKIVHDVIGDVKLIEKPVEFTPPKKEKKEKAPQQPKKEKKEAPKKKEVEEEDAPAEAPKPKHPLAALGNPKAPLDEWKRVYSNEETRETAIPWFWKNQYNPEEWSLYKVDYKYNDELTLTFMSNNLVGGFFNRLSASTKYLFGCMVVYGENNDNGITGFFLVRGQDYVPAFEVAPDWESYSYTKLDASDPESKEFIENMLAWDKPVIVDGKSREIADGKVFK
ncbi:translation elongation factor eEF1 gamma [Scheffersomyces xylosifermentans]|uniref:translation elongation factor eEF1 gamma n=1 Tax=Scheffersomyces xylosifermentans TaxID=1304137 RepID=UPI00315CBCC1